MHVADANGYRALRIESFKGVFTGPKPVNALELEYGVVILIGGWIVVLPRTRPPPNRRCTILMADLEEAERRSRSNMSWLLRARQEYKSNTAPPIKLLDRTYNVDMLPALVGTLSALHEFNKAVTGEQPQSTKVFLETKPRPPAAAARFGGRAVWPLIRSGVDGVTQADVATARSC
ncbi:uncharacterized protein Triagg1_9481 [Trichoderma aggressivum f. europaeum]|uniref:Uncharacterized protein n=1 Tax=Trichoderma aggressivum f. europaeum TaxID=173218 RepID=A0AAE1LWE9_9HYPO|nr:hypothetical protein Triagg1_9481 [Trichoderma aggressivum f. europaeum]